MVTKNWLYPPEGLGVEETFELMERAAGMVINKSKEYPKQQISGIGSVAKAVYANRIFAFRFNRLFKARKGKILGGAVSRAGILLVYNGFTKRYSWEQVTSCKVTVTRIQRDYNANVGSDPRNYYYDAYLGFGEDEGFNVNLNAVNFFEFGGRMVLKMNYSAEKDEERAAEMFAFYYNRVRSERMGIALTKGNKKVLLHQKINQNFMQEVQKRFKTPEGLFFKKRLKRMRITPDLVTFYKRRGKKIEGTIKWDGIDNIIVAIGASYTLWLIQYKDGVDYQYEFVWPGGWKLEPPILENKYEEKREQQIILPLCWLESL